MFKNLVRKKVESLAFRTLLNKTEKDQKGKHLDYTSMKMADYLHPECNISLLDKYEMF